MIKLNAIIEFHFLTRAFLPKRKKLRTFLLSLFKSQRVALDNLQIIFCKDDYLLSLNKQFLNHSFYTDILSFPLSKKGDPLIAEIYISIDRVRENAQAYDRPVLEELHRVIFHGVLHFCGFKDKSKSEIEKMRFMENKCLKNYFKLLA